MLYIRRSGGITARTTRTHRTGSDSTRIQFRPSSKCDIKTKTSLWPQGCTHVLARPELPAWCGPSRTKPTAKYHFPLISLNSAVDALRPVGDKGEKIKFALAGFVCTTRVMHPISSQQADQSAKRSFQHTWEYATPPLPFSNTKSG